MNCLQESLRFLLKKKKVPDFVKRHGGYWFYYLYKWFENNKINVFRSDKLESDGIAIYWRNNHTSTHAVVIKDHKIIFNPNNLELEELREMLVFQNSFPPYIISH